MLLKNLSLAAVRNKPVSPAAPMELADEVEMTLGEGMHSWSLWQTRRELEYLREENINLLYVKAGSDAQGSAPDRYTLQPIPVDQNVLRQLKKLEKTPMPVGASIGLTPRLTSSLLTTRFCTCSPCSISVTLIQGGWAWKLRGRNFDGHGP